MAGAAPAAQDATRESVTSDGRARTYYRFLPDNTASAPLVVLLHGSGRDGRTLIEPWRALARKEGLALVAPDSSERQSWNIGRDGPAFLHDVIEAVRTAGRIDGTRMYLFGHSAGGHHALDMALLESEYFAAVAVHAGALTHDQETISQQAERKIPIAMWNGTDDKVVPVQIARATREFLIARGFEVTLTEMPRHTHDYYGKAADINRSAWEFLKQHRLAGEPKYKQYVIGK
jgi:poly(3-hydroxybutyrate) depolymerase